MLPATEGTGMPAPSQVGPFSCQEAGREGGRTGKGAATGLGEEHGGWGGNH